MKGEAVRSKTPGGQQDVHMAVICGARQIWHMQDQHGGQLVLLDEIGHDPRPCLLPTRMNRNIGIDIECELRIRVPLDQRLGRVISGK